MGSSQHYDFIVSKLGLALVAVVSLCCADDPYLCSRATYFGSPDCIAKPNGACGFGEFGRTVNNGEVIGVSRLFRNGSGCGACYQVRCTVQTHCSDDGTKVMVMDYGVGPYTDFVMSERAYANLARPKMADQLLAYGVVDIEYRRIPCNYGGKNLMIKVHERSHYPYYLAILPIYQAGTYDVIDFQIWQEDCKEWRGMRRVYGAVWDMQNPSLEGGAGVKLRFQVSGGATAETKWVQLANAIPCDWKAGVEYDTSIQLN
ncbi:hypothetical protein ACS0TY_027499 [Phlomoides rotata]